MERTLRLGEVFDPKAPLAITGNCRPHWSQTGAIVFLTFRTIDSLPAAVLRRWEREKQAWVNQRAGSTPKHWSQAILDWDAQ